MKTGIMKWNTFMDIPNGRSVSIMAIMCIGMTSAIRMLISIMMIMPTILFMMILLMFTATLMSIRMIMLIPTPVLMSTGA